MGPQNHGKDPAWENCVSLGGGRNCAGAPGSKLAAAIIWALPGRWDKNGDFMGFLRELMVILWAFIFLMGLCGDLMVMFYGNKTYGDEMVMIFHGEFSGDLI